MKDTDFLQRLDEIGEDFSIRNSLGGIKFNREIPTWRPNAESPTTAPLAVGMANCVGGSTVHFTGCFWRFLESDFRIRSETVKRYGAGALPKGARVSDWPLTYEELEPYYDKVEYQLGVSGEAGSNPFEAPRSREFPMPPLQSFGLGKHMAKTMKKLGYNPFPQPAAILTCKITPSSTAWRSQRVRGRRRGVAGEHCPRSTKSPFRSILDRWQKRRYREFIERSFTHL